MYNRSKLELCRRKHLFGFWSDITAKVILNNANNIELHDIATLEGANLGFREQKTVTVIDQLIN